MSLRRPRLSNSARASCGYAVSPDEPVPAGDRQRAIGLGEHRQHPHPQHLREAPGSGSFFGRATREKDAAALCWPERGRPERGRPERLNRGVPGQLERYETPVRVRSGAVNARFQCVRQRPIFMITARNREDEQAQGGAPGTRAQRAGCGSSRSRRSCSARARTRDHASARSQAGEPRTASTPHPRQ
jgi:hypothetical protein